MNIPHEWLDACIEISLHAGKKILEVYHSHFAVQHKDDNSPLTQADIASHHCIAEGLKRLAPEIPLLSEEDASIAFETRRAWSRFWLVDPLDGTKEFIKRNGEFTTNIALIENGRPVMGVVYAPVLGQTFAGMQGHGALKIEKGHKKKIHTRRVPDRPVLLASRSHREGADEAWQTRLPPHDEINKGSSLKFCLVAEGVADFYFRGGPTSEWDTAAGQCVVEQAGGCVLRSPEWTPLDYNQKESLLNPHFAVIGDQSHDWRQYF